MGSEKAPKCVVVNEPTVLWDQDNTDKQRQVVVKILEESEAELAQDDDTNQPDPEVNDAQG